MLRTGDRRRGLFTPGLGRMQELVIGTLGPQLRGLQLVLQYGDSHQRRGACAGQARGHREHAWRVEVSGTDTQRPATPDDEDKAFLEGVDAAMKHAAIEARRRAIETTGSVGTWRNGKLVRDTEV